MNDGIKTSVVVEHDERRNKDMAVEHGMNGGIKTWLWSTV